MKRAATRSNRIQEEIQELEEMYWTYTPVEQPPVTMERWDYLFIGAVLIVGSFAGAAIWFMFRYF